MKNKICWYEIRCKNTRLLYQAITTIDPQGTVTEQHSLKNFKSFKDSLCTTENWKFI